MNKKIIIIFVAVFLLVACSSNKDNNAVGEKAQKVIEAMLTCPNTELFNSDAITYIGLGVNTSDEEKEKIEAASEKIEQNWDAAVGEYFGHGYLKASLSQGSAQKYLANALIFNKTISIENMTLKEKKDALETVLVDILVDGEKQQVEISFTYDTEGLIKTVSGSDIEFQN